MIKNVKDILRKVAATVLAGSVFLGVGVGITTAVNNHKVNTSKQELIQEIENLQESIDQISKIETVSELKDRIETISVKVSSNELIDGKELIQKLDDVEATAKSLSLNEDVLELISYQVLDAKKSVFVTAGMHEFEDVYQRSMYPAYSTSEKDEYGVTTNGRRPMYSKQTFEHIITSNTAIEPNSTRCTKHEELLAKRTGNGSFTLDSYKYNGSYTGSATITTENGEMLGVEKRYSLSSENSYEIYEINSNVIDRLQYLSQANHFYLFNSDREPDNVVNAISINFDMETPRTFYYNALKEIAKKTTSIYYSEEDDAIIASYLGSKRLNSYGFYNQSIYEFKFFTKEKLNETYNTVTKNEFGINYKTFSYPKSTAGEHSEYIWSFSVFSEDEYSASKQEIQDKYNELLAEKVKKEENSQV